MTESEKLNDFKTYWKETKISPDDFKLVAKHIGKTPQQYAIALYDESVLLGRNLTEYICENVQEQLADIEAKMLMEKELIVYENNLLNDAIISPTTKWRIRKLPHGQWEEAIDKATRRSRPTGLDVSIINSKEANDLFLSQDGLGFYPMVVFSVLCRACAIGREAITFRELWRITHRNRWWNRKDFDSFVEEVKDVVRSLDSHFAEEESKDWIYTIDGNQIVIRCNPQIWKNAVAVHHVCNLKDMLGGSCHLPWLQKVYIARWVRIAGNKKNAMLPVITYQRLKEDAGAFSLNKVKGYMQWLEEKGLIANPTVGDGKIEWQVVKQENQNE